MPAVGPFQQSIEAHTGLRLPAMQTAPASTVPTRRVGRRPGGLLRDGQGGNIRLTNIRLGQGSRGEVVVCFNERTRALMAAKKSPKSVTHPADVAHEAQAYLQGRSALAPYAILAGPKKTYMLLALCAGSVQSLIDCLSPNERVAARTGLALIATRHILAALDVLHSRGLGHRDIKPGNLLFINEDVVLSDYDRVAHHDVAYLMPTLWYAPPEALGLVPARGLLPVDVWSLGATILEIACGSNNRLLTMRRQAEKAASSLLERGALPRGGAFESCYRTCTRDESYRPDQMLGQAILLRAMTLAFDLDVQGKPQHAPLPPDIAPDDPVRLISTKLRVTMQACMVDMLQNLPVPLRDILRRMLAPLPQMRPRVAALRVQLAAQSLDDICDVQEGRALLQRMSTRAASLMQARILPEASPSVAKRVFRLLTR